MTLLPFDAGKPVVAVAVNARILRMQVDTGAETSVLTEQGAQTLGLAPGPARVRVAGLGGAAGYGSVQLRRIDLAGQQLRGLTLPVMHLEGADGMDGLIGADLLAPYQVQIDLPGHVMTLFRAYGCRHPAPLWPAISIGWTGAGGLPIVDGWLDGRKLALLLDTGANVSAVDAGAAALATAESRADLTSRSYGAGGLAIAARAHRFTRLQIGGVSIAAPTLRVIRLPPHLGIGGLIGMDLLAGRRLWLDAAGRRLYISDPPQS
jgi:predicted aspartyl protease